MPRLSAVRPPSRPLDSDSACGPAPTGSQSRFLFTMNRLRKSFRDSFRRKKDRVPESSKPHQWEDDERAVRIGDCSFPVKYLGCLEVFDSRGMQVCEDALKVLRSSRRRPIKAVLHVTGDGLRVVDDEKRGLIVDQTIEKVSFCAPDRFHERGFSYICRDGTTRRWMCHGFHATKDSGERLSHAVGCAFAVCLEKKQKRDREHSVTMQFDNKTSTFTRNGSFRQSTITDRLKDPQIAKPAAPPPVKPVHNPFAIERPRATPDLIQRQGSFRGFTGLSQASPFKRQLSLRLSDLPSNIERQRTQSSGPSDLVPTSSRTVTSVVPDPTTLPSESIPVTGLHKSDTISEMCKELSKGLQMLTEADPVFLISPSTSGAKTTTTPSSIVVAAKTPDSSYSPAASPTKAIPCAAPASPLRPENRCPNMNQQRSHSLVGSSPSNGSVGWPSGSSYVSPGPLVGPHSVAVPSAVSAPRTGPATPARQRITAKAMSLDYNSHLSRAVPRDPFDTDWAAIPGQTSEAGRSTNPFAQTSTSLIKTFEVQM